MPGRKVNPEKNPSNPEWKTISLPYRAVMILDFGIKRHPERFYKGIGDKIIDMLRNDSEYLEWEKKYDETNKLEPKQE